jgi:hypothetical protein
MGLICCLVTATLLNCTTTLVSTKKEDLASDILEHHAEMEILSAPSAPSGEISASTDMNTSLVLSIASSVRRRHNYREVTCYRRYLNPILRDILLVGGPALSVTGLFGIGKGYVVLGEYSLGIGLLATVPALTLRERRFQHVVETSEEDKSPVTSPAANADLSVAITGTSSSVHFVSDDWGRATIPLDSIIDLCPKESEIEITARLSQDTSVRTEYTILPHYISSFRKYDSLRTKAEKERELAEARERAEAEARARAEAELKKKKEAEWNKKLADWVSYAEQYGDDFKDRWLDWGDYAIDRSLYFEDDMMRASAAGYSPTMVVSMARLSYSDAIAYLIVNRISNERLLTTWGGDDFCSAVRRAVIALYGSGR